MRAIELTKDRLLVGQSIILCDILADAPQRFIQLSLVYIIAIFLAKVSVLLLYLRFFRIVELTKYLIWVGLAFTTLTTLGFLSVEIVQATTCMGLQALSVPFCKKVNKIVVGQAAVNVLLDYYILLIPLQQVWQLKVETRKKLGVAAVFGVGFM